MSTKRMMTANKALDMEVERQVGKYVLAMVRGNLGRKIYDRLDRNGLLLDTVQDVLDEVESIIEDTADETDTLRGIIADVAKGRLDDLAYSNRPKSRRVVGGRR